MSVELDSQLTPETLALRLADYYTDPEGIFNGIVQTYNHDYLEPDLVGEMKDLKAIVISDILVRGISNTLDEILISSELSGHNFTDSTFSIMRNNGLGNNILHGIFDHDIIRREFITDLVKFSTARELSALQRTNFKAFWSLAQMIGIVEEYRSSKGEEWAGLLPSTEPGIFEYVLNHIALPTKFASLTTAALTNEAKHQAGRKYRSAVFNSLPTLMRMASQNLHTGVGSVNNHGFTKPTEVHNGEYRLNLEHFEYLADKNAFKLRTNAQGRHTLYLGNHNSIGEKTSKCPAAIFKTRNISKRVKDFVSQEFDIPSVDPFLNEMDAVSLMAAVNLAFTEKN